MVELEVVGNKENLEQVLATMGPDDTKDNSALDVS